MMEICRFKELSDVNRFSSRPHRSLSENFELLFTFHRFSALNLIKLAENSNPCKSFDGNSLRRCIFPAVDAQLVNPWICGNIVENADDETSPRFTQRKVSFPQFA
jgi:hypothetical protein